MFRGSTRHWSAFGAALMLTVALSNTSCCSSRTGAVSQMREATERVAATEHTESQNEEKREMTLEETTEGVTVTEIEVYDTTQPKDPETGLPPVKARIKQRQDQSGKSVATEQSAAAGTTESDSVLEHEGGELDEVTETATKAPSLWDRIKQGAAWATAIVILAIAGVIIYKIRKI